jgi:hypothetical protein
MPGPATRCELLHLRSDASDLRPPPHFAPARRQKTHPARSPASRCDQEVPRQQASHPELPRSPSQSVIVKSLASRREQRIARSVNAIFGQMERIELRTVFHCTEMLYAVWRSGTYFSDRVVLSVLLGSEILAVELDLRRSDFTAHWCGFCSFFSFGGSVNIVDQEVNVSW